MLKGKIISKAILQSQVTFGMQVYCDGGLVFKLREIGPETKHGRQVMLRGDKKPIRYLSECKVLLVEFVVSPDNDNYRLSELRYDIPQQLYFAQLPFDETDWLVVALRDFVDTNKVVDFEFDENSIYKRVIITAIEQETFTLDQLEEAFKQGQAGVYDNFQEWRDLNRKHDISKKIQA